MMTLVNDELPVFGNAVIDEDIGKHLDAILRAIMHLGRKR
jgi:hypothetical protein